MALRVGRIPYLHCDPFYVDMARRGFELCELEPRPLAAAAARGDIDAGPIPLVDALRLEAGFEPLAGFCLASVRRAGSALLFSTRRIAALQGAEIAIADQAATAPQLLHVLLTRKYRLQPAAYVALDAPHDACLLIGQEALRQRLGMPGFDYIYDLGAEWYAWTGLPFVFCRWMVRRDAAPQDKAALQEALYVGLEDGVNALYALAKPREDLLMLPRDIVAHIQGLRYYVGQAEQRAIDVFRRYLEQGEG
jgi:chorismate dehydratase